MGSLSNPPADDVLVMGGRTNSKVPSGGLFLAVGGVTTSVSGFDLSLSPSVLVEITVTVNIPDPTNNYDFELVSDPTGSPVVIDKVSLPSTSRSTSSSFSTDIPQGTELGMRAVRTSGSGNSTFADMVMVARFSS